jgi:hypothetical protein
MIYPNSNPAEFFCGSLAPITRKIQKGRLNEGDKDDIVFSLMLWWLFSMVAFMILEALRQTGVLGIELKYLVILSSWIGFCVTYILIFLLILIL